MSRDSLHLRTVETPEGLLVPADAVTKARRVIPRDDAKVIRRAINMLRRSGIETIMLCSECQKESATISSLAVLRESRVPESGELVWECNHARRILEDTL